MKLNVVNNTNICGVLHHRCEVSTIPNFPRQMETNRWRKSTLEFTNHRDYAFNTLIGHKASDEQYIYFRTLAYGEKYFRVNVFAAKT
ncbi:hypothetical protein CFFPNG_02034 [Methylorubrum aminovorans]